MPGPAPAGAFVGVDLAWGDRARSGIAVLDITGALVRSATVADDDDCARVLSDDAHRARVVAIDAPLLVPNDTGRRSCEASVARDFARFHAGPYPSNRGIAAFREGTRGARLAARFGWYIDGDPEVNADSDSPDRPLAIEVYPHPAMVVLFSLDRVLPYKARAGRSIDTRRRALAAVMTHLQRVGEDTLRLSRSPRWQQLAEDVDRAQRATELKRAEDEIDAIMCAYLAWMWHHEPQRLVRHGDGSDGYIVTPRLP